MQSLENKKIVRVKQNDITEVDDIIAVEKKIKVYVNNEEIVSLSASPCQIRELVVGFLMTEGILKGDWCPEKITIEENEKQINAIVELEGHVCLDGKTITSGCMAAVSFLDDVKESIRDNLKIKASALFNLFRHFQEKSILYRTTGCIHAAAIADENEILFIAEDVGRHNAVDKIIGWTLLNRVSFKGKIMLVSGRISSEMALKTAKWKIPLIVSRTAPTSLAIEFAEKAGLTLIGFLRGQRFNIYSHPERIVF
ncbi:formate dehydrogenase accessory sulfurtransferase FdhD [Thermodesulfovibrio yellowstonii]|uniref:Sulfur carrier protein FdhD n=1 Tax=Thermodesulfovibrio yellowstonii TaxID=28262 RepID=A0A9W6LLJ6_9BACT|nr:formate dehydrogenase accessory sulfurtransferase FdhD [Thermodesulfovibrio islandicus]GLI53915.1 sulfurtransferase FdhD [Thermodesulfovibrio islandicus]